MGLVLLVVAELYSVEMNVACGKRSAEKAESRLVQGRRLIVCMVSLSVPLFFLGQSSINSFAVLFTSEST